MNSRRSLGGFLALSLAFVLLTVGMANAAETPKSLTLAQAYSLALKRSEDAAISQEGLETAHGHFLQALDVVLPDISYQVSRKRQDAASDSSSDTVSSSFSRRSTPEQKFTFTQPLFSGFKEFAALQASGSEKSQKKHEKERAEQLLFIDVMDSFYLLAQALADEEILTTTRDALKDRVAEISTRVELGRSRESELLSADAELKIAEAWLVDARRQQKIARQLLEFYIGRPLAEPLGLGSGSGLEPAPLETYLGRVSLRPDVRAAEKGLALYEQNVIVARSVFFPAISLEGNYYTERVGIQSGIDWDATLKFDIPLFEGTGPFGDVKVAESAREIQEQTLSKTRRKAELQIRDEHQNWASAIERENVYREAADAMKKNYESNAEDYRHNLVNNLDVLDALRRYQEVRRTLNSAQFDTRRSQWRLRIASGETP